jgi:hypothetical protein
VRESVVIDLDKRADARAVVVHAAGSELVMGGLTLRGLELIYDYRKQWVRGGARIYANQLLAWSVWPRLTPEQVDAMPEPTRGRLRVALVEKSEMDSQWRALYGTHLSGDERLLFVLQLHAAQVAREMAERVGKSISSALRAARGSQAGQKFLKGPAGARRELSHKRVGLASLSQGGALAAPSTLGFASAFKARESQSLLGPLRKMAGALGLGSAAADRGLTSLGRYKPLLGGLGAEQKLATAGMLGDLKTSRAGVAGSLALAKRLPGPGKFGLAGPVAGVTRMPVLPRLAQVIGAQGLPAGVGALARPAFVWPSFKLPQGLRDYFDRQRERLELAERLEQRYQQDQLLYLLEHVSWRFAGRLIVIERVEVERLLLDALEEVATDPQVIALFEELIQENPYLDDEQRGDLLHGLEHLAQGDFGRAHAPLKDGLEGALWASGHGVAVIGPDRTHLDKPSKKIQSVETVVRRLPLGNRLKAFIVRCVFGGEGDPYRHGVGRGARRERVLFMFAALAGVLEHATGEPVEDVLAAALSSHMPRVLENRASPAASLRASAPLGAAQRPHGGA